MRNSRIAAILAFVLSVCMPNILMADGTEQLGSPSIIIANGNSATAAGTGMNNGQGTININVPTNATIRQVLLYWEGWYGPAWGPGDNTIIANGTEIVGMDIGGNFKLPYTDARPVTYRADVTNLNLVRPGANSVSISGLMFTNTSDGAGILVIYDNPQKNPGAITIKDGSDFALVGQPGAAGVTEPQTFEFTPSPFERQANLIFFFSSTDCGLQNYIKVAVYAETDLGTESVFNNTISNADGERWDTLKLSVTIPANTQKLVVQAVSGPAPTVAAAAYSSSSSSAGSSGSSRPQECPNDPSSFVWNMVALGLEYPNLPPDCDIGGPYSSACGGARTTINVMSNSYDPEGKVLSYSWSTNCSNSTLTSADSQSTQLVLTLPGTGVSQECSVNLIVSDGAHESTCSTLVSVPGCSDCPAGQKKDQCGVCGGNNSSCKDCLGVPNGGAVYDKCGVCNGNGTTCACIESSAISEVNTVQQTAYAVKQNTSLAIAEYGRRCTRHNRAVKAEVKKMNKMLTKTWSSHKEILTDIPVITRSCNANCAQVQNTDDIARLLGYSKALYTTAVSTINRTYTCSKEGGSCNGDIVGCWNRRNDANRSKTRFLKDTKKLHKQLESSISMLPSQSYQCTVK